ncbi:hypothetical protein [Ardenticatena maritima]|uniref:Uncharacterized protein n=1 Tax=Ardenticatena maritima TaxID=872965 RepID=A0A0N8GSH1_9CHLR|nr:hypothetical protein [Ardenticatena maritima]KPL89282.1 hypothetical protein SE16_02060 [Ardenticatena maritima]
MAHVKVVVIEPYEAYEILTGEVGWLPFSLKTEDGRKFSLFPHHGLFDIIRWLKEGHLVVDMRDTQTGKLLRGSMTKTKS